MRAGDLVRRRRELGAGRGAPVFRIQSVVGRDACLVWPDNGWFQGFYDISELEAVAGSDPPVSAQTVAAPRDLPEGFLPP